MTAEIAIMNKLAVALAADSAVTIQYPNGPKIYNTASKLFMLSPKIPVGVMFYGSAEFMGVPWETIMKFYSTELGDVMFKTLEDYTDHFLEYLRRKNNPLFSVSQQDEHFRASFRSYLGLL